MSVSVGLEPRGSRSPYSSLAIDMDVLQPARYKCNMITAVKLQNETECIFPLLCKKLQTTDRHHASFSLPVLLVRSRYAHVCHIRL